MLRSRMQAMHLLAIAVLSGTLASVGPQLNAQVLGVDTFTRSVDTARPNAGQERKLEEVTIVSSTRTTQSIENAPIKVEVLGPEEMSEENGIKPGNVASLLGDVSGIQIQQASALNGASNVRIQGLEGRYTQLLRDGMPLYEGLSGGFGILNIPPLDLRQIELIKGSASTLYGGGAIGGLINFISKRPKMSQEAIVTLNASSLLEKNVNGYVARRYKKWGYNLFAGFTHQSPRDVDGDGFTDLPLNSALTAHPRLFFYPDEHTTVLIGYSISQEKRDGGDYDAIKGESDSLNGLPRYAERNNMSRHTGELIAERTFTGGIRGTLKGTFSRYIRETKETPSEFDFRGWQDNYYAEASVLIPKEHLDLVGGVNVTGDAFHKERPASIPLGDFANNVAGVFGQATFKLKGGTSIEGGLRLDHHDRFGFFFLPRVAALYRVNEHWALRAGYGAGYRYANVLAPQNVEYALYELLPLGDSVAPERSYGLNLEVNYRTDWDDEHSFFINHAFFLTRLNDPVVAKDNGLGNIFFANEADPIETRGSDTYIRAQLKHWELYLGYTFTDAVRYYIPEGSALSRFMPLTPRNRAASTLVWEPTEEWRIGLEASYNGGQYRDGEDKTPDYLFLAASAMRAFGKHWQVVLNGENLLDYRQSAVEPLYTGSRNFPLFRPLWAPIDGRVINLSLKWAL